MRIATLFGAAVFATGCPSQHVPDDAPAPIDHAVDDRPTDERDVVVRDVVASDVVVSDVISSDVVDARTPDVPRDALQVIDAVPADVIAPSDVPRDAGCVGADCGATAPCAAGESEASFRRLVGPPAEVRAGQRVSVSVTVANCSGRPWTTAREAGAPSGIKLGSEAPRDTLAWGMNRVALPVATVAPGAEVTIPFEVTAPDEAGVVRFSWGLVDEGVRWLTGRSAPVDVRVQVTPRRVALCAGVTVDIAGVEGAAAALQRCVDATPEGGALELPPGIYRMDGQLALRRPITVRTAGLGADAPPCAGDTTRCATLRASAELDVPGGFVFLGETTRVALDHLVLDGNREARVGSAAYTRCAGGDNRNGFNAMLAGCARCSFTASVSMRALCGTGFEWRGDEATVVDSAFRANGDHATRNLWSDGLTLLQSDRARVERCTFADNSDIGFISGGARGGVFRNNVITQGAQDAFGALMLDNFNGGTHGDFTGATVTGNTIDCGAGRCHFGIVVGPHAWYRSANITGGEVTGNTVRGALLGVNADGAGTAASPVQVFGNVIVQTFTRGTFTCGSRATSAFNISPDSVIDRRGETGGVTAMVWHDCP